jgi:hypothetical protein
MSTELLERPKVSISDPSFRPDHSTEPLFTREELRRFEEDDTEAGRRIGKILTSLFVYTLIAMSVVIWWSLTVIKQRSFVDRIDLGAAASPFVVMTT